MVARHVLPLLHRDGAPRALTNNDGEVLAGQNAAKSGPSTAIGFLFGYLMAAWLGLFDGALLENVRHVPLLGFQSLEFHTLSFDMALVLPFVAATIASNLCDGGLIISSQKANDSSWIQTDTGSLGGGIVASGIANISSGLLGGGGTNVSGGNISLASATGSTSRRIGI